MRNDPDCYGTPAPSDDDAEYSELLREVQRKLSRGTGSTFFNFADRVAREITQSRLGKFLEYRLIAAEAGRADRIDALLLDVLQRRRSVDSALDCAAALLRDLAAAGAGSRPEARLSLRHALAEIFEVVPLLTEPAGHSGDDRLPRLRSAFETLKTIPIETEMEPGDLRSLEGVLDLIDRHLPALRLCSEYRDDWRSLVERFNRHDHAEEGARVFRRVEFTRDSDRRLIRIASIGPNIDTLVGEEMVRGGVLVMHLESPRYLIVDLSAARALAFQAVQSLFALAQIARSRGVSLQIATGVRLYAKVTRLVPAGLLTFQRTFADCEAAIRAMESQEG